MKYHAAQGKIPVATPSTFHGSTFERPCRQDKIAAVCAVAATSCLLVGPSAKTERVKFDTASLRNDGKCTPGARKWKRKYDASHFQCIDYKHQCLKAHGAARMCAIHLADGCGLVSDPDDIEMWDGVPVCANEERRPPMIWIGDSVLTVDRPDPNDGVYGELFNQSRLTTRVMSRRIAAGLSQLDRFYHTGEVPREGEMSTHVFDIPVRPAPLRTITRVDAVGAVSRAQAARKSKARGSNVKLWLVDSGCGHDLISRKEVESSDLDCEDCPDHVRFSTANGSTTARQVAPLFIDELGCNVSPYVLPSTPAVVSMGKRCMHEGYSFVWMDGKSPYFITPDKRRMRLRVLDEIPYIIPGDPFCQPVKVDNLTEEERASMPAVREEPIRIEILSDRVDAPRNGGDAVPRVRAPDEAVHTGAGEPPVMMSPGPTVEEVVECEKIAAPNEVEGEAEPEQDAAQGEAEPAADPEQIAAQEEAEQAPAEEDQSEEAQATRKDLRAEAKSLRHLLTHQPKNPYCDACTRAKMRNKKRFAGAFDARREPKSWCELVTADHLVSKGDRMVGVTGAKNALVMKDLYSDLQHVAPVRDKTAGPVIESLTKFIGTDLKVVKSLYSDNSRELKKACRALRIHREPSLPGVPQSNSKIERTNLDVLEGTRTALVQAGLPDTFWPFAAPTYCFLRNTETEGREQGSRWAVAHNSAEFTGLRLPFGCEVIFKPVVTKKIDRRLRKKWGPAGSPGIFAGYEMKPGYGWTGRYKCWSLNEVLGVNMVTSVARFSKRLCDPHTSEVVKLPNNGEIRFPLKAEYDYVNFTVEGMQKKADKAEREHGNLEELKISIGDHDDAAAPDKPDDGEEKDEDGLVERDAPDEERDGDDDGLVEKDDKPVEDPNLVEPDCEKIHDPQGLGFLVRNKN